MQSSSRRAEKRTSARERITVNITDADLAQAEARFDSLIPGSAWCGYGAGDVDGAQRLLAFLNLEAHRAMTITRYSDGRCALTGDDGALWPEQTLEAILDRLEKIGSTAN